MQFPQYRKYKNHQSYFKITAEDQFTEYKIMGGKVEKFNIQARILPDRNYLQDLIAAEQDYWEKIDREEFTDFLKRYCLAE